MNQALTNQSCKLVPYNQLVGNGLIIRVLLKILGAKRAEDYQDFADYQPFSYQQNCFVRGPMGRTFLPTKCAL